MKKITAILIGAISLGSSTSAMAITPSERQIAALLQRQEALREQIGQVQLNLLVDSIYQPVRPKIRHRVTASAIVVTDYGPTP